MNCGHQSAVQPGSDCASCGIPLTAANTKNMNHAQTSDNGKPALNGTISGCWNCGSKITAEMISCPECGMTLQTGTPQRHHSKAHKIIYFN